MMYFYEQQQQQMMKQARCDDGFVYNSYDFPHQPPRVPLAFQYDASPAGLVYSTVSSPSHSQSSSPYEDNSDSFSCSSNEFVVDEFSRSNDSTEEEADEWRDVLSFFCGEFLQQEEQFPNEFPEQLI